ncbi:MAG: putative collagen-binding domain-containing protein, partial [Bacteroidota bacterium]
HALYFFNEYLPFGKMKNHDELVDSEGAWCFAQPGKVYAVYLKKGASTTLDLGDPNRTFTLDWYNPRSGGELQAGATGLTGKAKVGPGPDGEDWVALIRSTR